jgi:hypothetical protein
VTQPEPTELIYLPGPSPYPALIAVGIAFAVVGLFAWWPYSVAGGLIAIVSLIAWLRANRAEIASMPNEQATDTAPIPLRSPR